MTTLSIVSVTYPTSNHAWGDVTYSDGKTYRFHNFRSDDEIVFYVECRDSLGNAYNRRTVAKGQRRDLLVSYLNDMDAPIVTAIETVTERNWLGFATRGTARMSDGTVAPFVVDSVENISLSLSDAIEVENGYNVEHTAAARSDATRALFRLAYREARKMVDIDTRQLLAIDFSSSEAATAAWRNARFSTIRILQHGEGFPYRIAYAAADAAYRNG